MITELKSAREVITEIIEGARALIRKLEKMSAK
jgi:hypothetical protein